MCRIVRGDHHHAGGAAVETVDYAWTLLSADAAQSLHMVQQCVHQGASFMTGRWVHHHARRLVHHHQIRVVVQDL